MSTKQTGTPYTLVFFEPLAGYIYPRANDNHTAFKKITVNKTGVSPPFLHHCHPYFAIQNAIPKFLKHEATLTEKQKEIHLRLKIVEKAWDDYFDKVTSAKLDPPGAVGGPAADDAEDDNSGDDDGGAIGPPLKRPRITEDPSSNKNAGDRHVAPGAEDTNAYRHSKRPGLPLPPPTNPPHEDKREREDEDDKDEEKWLFRHSDWSHVTAWLADVPEECDSMEEQSVAWLVDEILRPPLQPPTTRDNWSNPPDTSKFSSTNWATWIKGNLLDYPMSPTGSWNESSSKSSS
ncbi:hypothetical protein BDV93DRAFT_66019 [Ceratobasidium sp. AG-I]|nr:hypothetical protein BDV93DRAFT_66019 [Ceratobasidium sp. AG-I]